MLPAGLPVPILAVIPVTDVAMILVPAVPRIIPAAKPVQPNAAQLVVTATPHAQAEAPLIPVQSWVITNAAMPADLVQPLVRPALPPPIPEVAADQPQMNAEQRPVIILINPAVRRAVPIPQALVPAGLTRFPTDAAELADVVNLVVLTLPMCLVLTDVLLNARVVLNVKLVKRQLPAALHILLAAVPAHVRVIVPVADVWVAAKELWILFVA